MRDPLASHECVALRGVELEVRLGAFAHERAAPQPLRVDVELYRRRSTLPAPPGLEDCLDYDRLFRYLTQEWPRRPHTPLLEELAEDLISFCLADQRVEACRVALRKPAVYGGRAVPEVTVYRRRME